MWVPAGVVFLSAVLAASMPDSTNPLVSYGLLGFILLALVYLLLSGKFALGRELDRVLDENRQLRERLPEAVSIQVLTTRALEESTKALRDVLVVLDMRQQRESR